MPRPVEKCNCETVYFQALCGFQFFFIQYSYIDFIYRAFSYSMISDYPYEVYQPGVSLLHGEGW